MKLFFKFPASSLIALSLAAIPTTASAADIAFMFSDGPTQEFFGRAHVAGTVSGVILGLTDNATSAPTAIQILSVPGGLTVVPGTYTAAFQDGGFTLTGGTVTAANFGFNFNDSNNAPFQLRFNCVGGTFGCDGATANLNLLFWNGGPPPVNGTGNQLGFAGVTYGSLAPAVPEPASWAMMVAGFGAIGFAMRRRQKVAVSYA